MFSLGGNDHSRYIAIPCPSGGLVDALDSKSEFRKECRFVNSDLGTTRISDIATSQVSSATNPPTKFCPIGKRAVRLLAARRLPGSIVFTDREPQVDIYWALSDRMASAR